MLSQNEKKIFFLPRQRELIIQEKLYECKVYELRGISLGINNTRFLIKSRAEWEKKII